MATIKRARRESRSVRLSEREWATAEAIAYLELETGAGHGLRTALRMSVDRIRRQGNGAELERLTDLFLAQRSDGDR
jgi:hypothetical protein